MDDAALGAIKSWMRAGFAIRSIQHKATIYSWISSRPTSQIFIFFNGSLFLVIKY